MQGGEGHHHLSAGNVITFEKLEAMFGAGQAENGEERGFKLAGRKHQDLLQELIAITEYQWRSQAPRSLIKGFLLSGPPGTGKTTLAKLLAYELGRRFDSDMDPPIALAFIDGGEISRSRYGESEERIRDIFLHARSGFTAARQRSVLLFDDVESIFMARGSEHAKEWHFSQDSVFFHSIDDLDASRSVIVLTSNRPDLIDDAIQDRFLSYVVDYPDLDTLLQMIAQLPVLAQLSGSQQTALKDELSAAARNGSVRSMRDAQRFAMRWFVTHILNRDSLSTFR